jgi:hypothetical protein
MSDATTTQGAAFGVAPLQVDPATLAPAPAAADVAVSRVPAEARARLRDRLRARRPLEELVDLGDGDFVLVKGMDVYATEAMQNAMRSDEEDGVDPDAPTKITDLNPRMLRASCFDPETGESVYGTGQPVQQADGSVVIDGFTDREINEQPIDVVNKLMAAINRVLGRTAAPGKDSPSTAATDSSSS